MRRIVPDLLLLGLDILLVAAWVDWLGRTGGGGAPAVWTGFVAGVAGYTLAAGLLALRVPDAAARLATVIGAVVVVLLAARGLLYPDADSLGGLALTLGRDLVSGAGFVSAAALLVIAVLVPWWRGANVAGGYPRPGRARRAAARALTLLATLVVFQSLAGGGVVFAPGPWIGLAAALALVGLAATRIRSVARGEDAGGAPVAVAGQRGTWIVVVGLAVGLVAGLGAVIGSIAEGAAPALLAPMRAVGVLLRTVIVAVLARLAVIIFFFVERMYRLLAALSDPNDESLRGDGSAELAERLERVRPVQWPPWLTEAWQWALGVLLLVIVFAWLWNAMRRRREHAPRDAEGMERSSGMSAARVGRDLADGLAALFDAASAALRARVDWRARGVRRLYGRLLRRLADAGVPREASLTPYEYRPRAEGALPDSSAEWDALTEAYVRARYGDEEPDEPTWAALHAAWQRLRAAVRRA